MAVHRLDRDTTGCLLFAKNRAALDAAIEVFKAHKVKKIYHTIVAGRFPYKRQTIDTPIGGDPAISHVTLETASADASLLRVHIETGRTNQIRRHLASIRHPVVGDRVFGLKSARDPRLMQVPRQMLHASTLEMPNPQSPGDTIRIHSPLPADFRATLRLFGMGRR
jgi:23S rRNA pseudouridine1911/1915/1917 synthase